MRPSFRLIAPAVLAAIGLTAAVVHLAPAEAEAQTAGEPSVTVISPVAESTNALGDVPVKMTVDLAGATSGRVDVSLGYYISAAADIPEGSCDAGCEVTVTLHMGDWDHPRLGSVLLSAKLTTADATTYGGGTVYFSGPVAISEMRHVRDGQLYEDAVVDAIGNFRVSASNDPGDAVAEVRLRDLAGTALVTESAEFTVTRGVWHDAVFSLDLTAVPNGFYELHSRTRGTDGLYGEGRRLDVRVNHTNPTIFDTGTDAPQIGSAMVSGNLTVQGPLLSGSKPDIAKATVDGVERSVLLLPGWGPGQWQKPGTKAQSGFYVEGPALGVGSHQVALRLLDPAGRVIGTPTTRTIVVIADSQATVVAPKLVVGRKSTVTLTADPPAGRQFDSCALGLSGPAGADAFMVGSWCSIVKPLPSLRTTAAVTPRRAGANTFTVYLNTSDGHTRNIPVAATVYSARRAAVRAPAVPYGARGTSTVVVQDSARLNTWAAAPAGITVSLQRLAVGTTRWVTVGSAKTVAGGIASIPFTSTTNGAFRAVLLSSVPVETTVSPVTSAVSSATVGWRLAPRAATRGKAVGYEVLANPYDAGALAQLQVRKSGTTKWVAVKSVAVPTSRIARLAYAFPSAGTWSVRVYRPATKQHAAGVSVALGVSVK